MLTVTFHIDMGPCLAACYNITFYPGRCLYNYLNNSFSFTWQAGKASYFLSCHNLQQCNVFVTRKVSCFDKNIPVFVFWVALIDNADGQLVNTIRLLWNISLSNKLDIPHLKSFRFLKENLNLIFFKNIHGWLKSTSL